MIVDPHLVRAFVDGAWYPVRILAHWQADWWFVAGHALPPQYRRMDGSRRVAVRVRDLQDLRGQPVSLREPSEAEGRGLGPEPPLGLRHQPASSTASPAPTRTEGSE